MDEGVEDGHRIELTDGVRPAALRTLRRDCDVTLSIERDLYSVTVRRAQEFAIRLALGGTQRDVLRVVLKSGAWTAYASGAAAARNQSTSWFEPA